VSRVLVTGATGFVGGRVVRRLHGRGDEVIAIVRSPSDDLADLGIEQRIVPLGDLEGLQQAGRAADAFVHTAAVAGPDHATAHRVNVEGTQAVAGAALLSGQRFVHVSTTSVYDLGRIGDVLVREDAPLVSRDGEAPPTSSSGSAYATTKAAAEDAVTRAVRTGLVGAILRPPAVLGAGPTSTWGTRVPTRIRDGEGPAIHPESTFGWVHVEDLVDAVVAALDADPEVVRGLTVNVVGGHVPFGTYRDEVASWFEDAPPSPEPDAAPWRGSYATDQLPANLAVRPDRSFEAAMQEIADQWQEAARG
jgi:2-alkyl-3-oxoalkanoate reductase